MQYQQITNELAAFPAKFGDDCTPANLTHRAMAEVIIDARTHRAIQKSHEDSATKAQAFPKEQLDAFYDHLFALNAHISASGPESKQDPAQRYYEDHIKPLEERYSRETLRDHSNPIGVEYTAHKQEYAYLRATTGQRENLNRAKGRDSAAGTAEPSAKSKKQRKARHRRKSRGFAHGYGRDDDDDIPF